MTNGPEGDPARFRRSLISFTSSCGVLSLNLKEAESYILRYMVGGRETIAQLKTRLRDALPQGKVPGLDGNMLKGQRNLDAKAQDVLNKPL